MHQPKNNIILFLFGKKIQEPNFTSSQNIKKKKKQKKSEDAHCEATMSWDGVETSWKSHW